MIQDIGSSPWGAVLLILLMVLESMPIIGLFIPGIFIMVALGSLSGTSYLSFLDCVIFSSIGALLGDSIGYWLGYYSKAVGLWGASSSKTRTGLERAKSLLKQHGRWAIFMGRFIWFFHPAVPTIAGMNGIRLGWFYLADIPAVILWVLIYAGIGHWLTGVARERTLEFSSVIGVLIGLALLVYLVRYLRQRHRVDDGVE